jgi:hypothetical protein
MLTRGSSTAARMPFIGPAAASRKAWRSCSVVTADFNLGGQIDHRDGGGRHAQGVAIQLASQVGDDQLEGRAAPGGGGDDAHRRCPGAAQVAVGQVQDLLIVGVGMDGGHKRRAILNLSCTTLTAGARPLVVQEAFEMTWCLSGSYSSPLTPKHHGQVFPFAGAVMMTFFAPPLVMWFSAPLTILPFLLTPSTLDGEDAGAFDHDIDAQEPHGILAGSVL